MCLHLGKTLTSSPCTYSAKHIAQLVSGLNGVFEEEEGGGEAGNESLPYLNVGRAESLSLCADVAAGSR